MFLTRVRSSTVRGHGCKCQNGSNGERVPKLIAAAPGMEALHIPNAWGTLDPYLNGGRGEMRTGVSARTQMPGSYT